MLQFLRNLFVKDLGLKLFSLALASGFYYTLDHFGYLSSRPNSLAPHSFRTFSSLPVVILSSAQDVRSVKVHPKEIEVTVEGETRVVNQLQDKDVRVIVDLTGIEAAHDLRKRVEVFTPPGVTYQRAEPNEVQVIFPAPDVPQ